MIISAIVAASKNWVIGKNNEIPWYIPNDLRYFRRMTLGHHIILGRKNYESIGKPLPKRTNLIVTRDTNFEAPGCLVVHSVEEAIAIAKKNKEEELMICGGGQIYAQTMPLVEKLYFTEIEAVVDGDVYFPEIDESEWDLISTERNQADDRHEYGYNFMIYERKK